MRRRAIGLLLLAGSAFAVSTGVPRLTARLDGDILHVSVPSFSFLTGNPLDRLHDGNGVAFVAQLSASGSPNYVVADARTAARFAFSYDIWEERFSVTRFFGDASLSSRNSEKRVRSHLSAAEAEAWCLDNLTLNRADLPADKPFYLQLDLRVEDPRDQPGVIGDSGLSVARLAELLSRPLRDKQSHWLLSSGALRLDDLRHGVRQ